jgi:hypothetical protein
MTTGYSGTPLPQKLGIQPGMILWVINAPVNYAELVTPLPQGAAIEQGTAPAQCGFIHYFATSRAQLKAELPRLCKRLSMRGTLWISWPKKTSGVPTDITEDTLRAVGLPLGIVDVKVCAIDDTWSGLKFMWRMQHRS